MIKKGLRGSMIFTLLLAAIVSFVTVFAVSFHANDAYAADADNRKLVLTFEPNGGGAVPRMWRFPPAGSTPCRLSRR